MKASKDKHTAAGTFAGYVFQFERALSYLARLPGDAKIAIEYADDLSVFESESLRLREQDKHTVGKVALGNRSLALWKTLKIWMSSRTVHPVTACNMYVLATNRQSTSTIPVMLRNFPRDDRDNDAIIEELRRAGKCPARRPKSQDVIDEVLSYSDSDLKRLIERVQLHEETGSVAQRRQHLIDGFAIDDRSDPHVILNALMGWAIDVLMERWRSAAPGVISRKSCVQQCREIERVIARRRLLPMPSRYVTPSESERRQSRTRTFVHQLSLVDAEEDEILEAIDHFIQFNMERHRLAGLGEIPDGEWRERGDRLKQRWKNLSRKLRRETKEKCPKVVGLRILEETTYTHCEPLSGEVCGELYMTSGHYHRLADVDEVWWHPQYDRAR